ncbi:hypothetical protein Tco_1456640 [Tanacetum coccineum]
MLRICSSKQNSLCGSIRITSRKKGMDFEDSFAHLSNGPLKEEVYVSQPEGFIDPEFPNHVYRRSYVPKASRLDIALLLWYVLVYQARPTVKHPKEVKLIFQYLRQSFNMGICIRGKNREWCSKKSQNCTAMSTAEAEYVSLSACCARVIWMRTQLLDYGYKYNQIPMYRNSKSVIAISCNPV